MEASKKQLIKELREYLDMQKDETTYRIMEIPELLKVLIVIM